MCSGCGGGGGARGAARVLVRTVCLDHRLLGRGGVDGVCAWIGGVCGPRGGDYRGNKGVCDVALSVRLSVCLTVAGLGIMKVDSCSNNISKRSMRISCSCSSSSSRSFASR